MTWQEADEKAQQTIITRIQQTVRNELLRYQEHLRLCVLRVAQAERRDAASEYAVQCRAALAECQGFVAKRERELARAQAWRVAYSPEGAFSPQVDFRSGWKLASLQGSPLGSWERAEYKALDHASLRLLVAVVAEDLPDLRQALLEYDREMLRCEDAVFYHMCGWLEANPSVTFAEEEKTRNTFRGIVEDSREKAGARLRAAAPYDLVMPALLQRMAGA